MFWVGAGPAETPDGAELAAGALPPALVPDPPPLGVLPLGPEPPPTGPDPVTAPPALWAASKLAFSTGV